MKRVCVATPVVAAALAGCSMASTNIVPAQYSDYDCAQITAEQRRMYARADEFAPLAPIARGVEYARLRVEHDALRDAAVTKQCGGTPAPQLEEATSVAAAELGDTGPRIAPPETLPE